MNDVLRIGFLGGPGIGKSTTAAEVFSDIKRAGYHAELVQEYVKGWAWENRIPEGFDQLYIAAKQIRQEERAIRGGAKVIITDSPIHLAGFYSVNYNATYANEIINLIRAYDREYPYLNILLNRSPNKEYKQDGRFQTKDEAKSYDTKIKEFMSNNGFEFVDVADLNESIYSEIRKELTIRGIVA